MKAGEHRDAARIRVGGFARDVVHELVDVLGEQLDRADEIGRRDWPDPQLKAGSRYRLLREGPLKLVAVSTGEHLLYDLAADPEETRDLGPERPADLARMVARLEEARAQLGLPALDAPIAAGEQAPELDDATKEQLKALGYAE